MYLYLNNVGHNPKLAPSTLQKSWAANSQWQETLPFSRTNPWPGPGWYRGEKRGGEEQIVHANTLKYWRCWTKIVSEDVCSERNRTANEESAIARNIQRLIHFYSILLHLQLLYGSSAGNISSKEKWFKKEHGGDELRDRRGGKVKEESNSLWKENVNERDVYKSDREVCCDHKHVDASAFSAMKGTAGRVRGARQTQRYPLEASEGLCCRRRERKRKRRPKKLPNSQHLWNAGKKICRQTFMSWKLGH